MASHPQNRRAAAALSLEARKTKRPFTRPQARFGDPEGETDPEHAVTGHKGVQAPQQTGPRVPASGISTLRGNQLVQELPPIPPGPHTIMIKGIWEQDLQNHSCRRGSGSSGDGTLPSSSRCLHRTLTHQQGLRGLSFSLKTTRQGHHPGPSEFSVPPSLPQG